MRIGVFSVIFQQLPFEQALDKILSYGATAVEIGTGGLPGAHHCPIDELLASEEKLRAYQKAIEERGMIISAFSCHWNPLDPSKEIAAASDELFRKTLRLAERCGVPAVNVMAGLPAGSATDKMPNWVTCPWPPHFREILDYQWNQVAIPY
jgi:sugar phosphate isomerase/epimerase